VERASFHEPEAEPLHHQEDNQEIEEEILFCQSIYRPTLLLLLSLSDALIRSKQTNKFKQ